MTRKIQSLSALPEALDPRYAYGLLTLEHYVKAKGLARGLLDIQGWLCRAYNDVSPYNATPLFEKHHEGYIPPVRRKSAEGYDSPTCRAQISTWEEMKALVESIYAHGGYDPNGVIWEVDVSRKPIRRRKDPLTDNKTPRLRVEDDPLSTPGRAPKIPSERSLEILDAGLQRGVADLTELVGRLEDEVSGLAEPHQELKNLLASNHSQVQSKIEWLQSGVHERFNDLESRAEALQESLDRLTFQQGKINTAHQELHSKVDALLEAVRGLAESINTMSCTLQARDSSTSVASPGTGAPKAAIVDLRPTVAYLPEITQPSLNRFTVGVFSASEEVPVDTDTVQVESSSSAQPVESSLDWREALAQEFNQESWTRMVMVCMTNRDLRVRVASALKERHAEELGIETVFNPVVHGLDLMRKLMSRA